MWKIIKKKLYRKLLGQIMAMQIPFVGFQPVKTSEHMAAAGVFGLIQVYNLEKIFLHSSSQSIWLF